MKKTSTVQLVRNATLKIRYAGHTMLIDPVLADKGTLISALGVNKTPRVHLTIPIQDIIGGVDMVLLTTITSTITSRVSPHICPKKFLSTLSRKTRKPS